ncbi:MAG: aminotransferase class V-fold PLP-dependent enzyme, partial [Bacteroidales bacterium]|nr:aminotransferase class V-fold PLP-dependent enzyme [Bacteroidales bacterium]
MSRLVYADNAATTKTDSKVLDVMMPFLTENYGNPSSIYKFGGKSRAAIEDARAKIATAIGADVITGDRTPEIFFTSGATESDNWAVFGVAEKFKNKGKHIISTKIEHHAILHSLEVLEKRGYEITLLDVDEDGLISPSDLDKAIRKDTILVTIMYANNEIGTIQPIPELAKIAKAHGVIFHTDAVQAVGLVEIDVKAQNIDMLSMSAHKIYGPKGVGALYIRKGLSVPNFIYGGAQEKARRGGTENLASIVGFGEAAKLATENIEEKG